jgi:hypothetical protein
MSDKEEDSGGADDDPYRVRLECDWSAVMRPEATECD